MKTAAGRFLLIFCLSAQTLWAAGPTGIETQKTGTTGVTTGLTGGPTTGPNSNLGSGPLQDQKSMNMGGTLGGTVVPTPQVEVNKTVTAAPVVPNSFVIPQGQTPASVTPQTNLTQTPAPGSRTTKTPVQPLSFFARRSGRLGEPSWQPTQ